MRKRRRIEQSRDACVIRVGVGKKTMRGRLVSSAACGGTMTADARVAASCLRYLGLARKPIWLAPAPARVPTCEMTTEPSPSAHRQDGRRFRLAANLRHPNTDDRESLLCLRRAT